MKIKKIYFRDTTNHVQHMIQRLVKVGFVVTDGCNSQGCLLPEIIIFNLSHRYIKLIPNPVF